MKSTVATPKKGRASLLTRNVDMLHDPIASSSVIYAIPIFLSAILQSLYNAADIAVVGNYGTPHAVAAVGATATIIGMIVNVFMNVATGYSVIIARVIGANDDFRIRRAISTGYTFSLMLGVTVAIAGFFLAKPLLLLTDCPADIIDDAALYIKIYMIGVPASMFYNFMSAVIRINGDTKRPFWYLAVSGAVNIVLNIVLVLTLENPVVGVAIATVASMIVSALLIIIRLMRMEGAFRLDPFKFNFNGEIMLKIVKYGIPSAISAATFAMTNVQVQSAINGFGETGIAGNTASIVIENFIFAITSNVCVVVSSFIGQNIGADQRKRTVDILRTSYLLWGIVGAVIATLSLLLGPLLLSFIVPGSPDAVAFGTVRLTYISIATVIHALISINHGALQGFGKTLYQMLVNIIGICGFRFLWMLVVFPKEPTADMLYLCYPVSYALVLFVSFVMVMTLVRRYKRGDNFTI